MSQLLDSLKARLFFSMLLLTIIALPILAVALTKAFEEHIKDAAKNELAAYSYSILSVAEPVYGQLFLPELLLETQFNVIDSGLYALFYPYQQDDETLPTEPLWRSSSALSINVDKPFLHQANIGESGYFEQEINGQPHIIFSYSVSFTEFDKELPVSLFIIKNKMAFEQTVDQFKQQIIKWLAFIFVLLVLVQLIWLFWTLKPLAKFKDELSSIKQGHSEKVKGQYPQELRQVTEQLNVLLHTEQHQRVRYRNALSDLAHSLKTPLAVIQTQIDDEPIILQEITKITQTIEHQLKRAQSAGESSWRLGCSINDSVTELTSALKKIYQDKNLTFIVNVPEKSQFRGDKADLTELLGNLLDNACKAAKSVVAITVEQSQEQLCICITDDGNGMTKEQRQSVIERGTRADTYQEGHGIGLAIVKDLVESYGGQMLIKRDEKLGGALFMLTFEQS